MKGQIPIKYIIAVILGISVLALIGYWFFIVAGGFVGQLTEAQCRIRLTEYCMKALASPPDLEADWTSNWEGFEARCAYLDWKVNRTACQNVFRGVFPG
jgi:hypothetical protein